MKKKRIIMLILCALILTGILAVVSYAGSAKKPDMVINLDVCKNARVTKIIAYFGKWNLKPAVWIEARIKNTSDKPMAFKAKCYMDGTDLSRGFSVPKVGKPPLQPQKEGKAKFPFTSDKLPKKFSIVVTEMPIIDLKGD
jgi:hypothetical protein